MDLSDLKSWYLSYVTLQASRCVNFSVSDNATNIDVGDIFICIKGGTFDGHNFINKAIKNGAGAIVVQADRYKQLKAQGIYSDQNIVIANNTQIALAHLAKWHYFQEKAPINFLGVNP